jgi:Ca-activated chloride channel family protein
VRKALSDLLGIDRGEAAPEEGVKPGETVIEEETRGKKETYADVLLITDGEDQDSYPVHAARRAADLDVGIYAVGLGSEEGSSIPVTGEGGRVEFLRSRAGEVHRSKLDSKTLQQMVDAAPRGRYLPAGTNNFDLVDFYQQTIAEEGGREVIEEQVFWTEIFQPFLLAGLALYLIHLVFPERPRRGALSRLEEGA